MGGELKLQRAKISLLGPIFRALIGLRVLEKPCGRANTQKKV
jgi:hypothetical protein